MGVATIIVERNETTVQAPRAVSIDDESMRTMQAAGLHEQVQAITARGYGSLYRAPNGKVFAQVKPATKEYGFDKRNGFQQPDLEDLLRRGLTRHKSVETRFLCEMLSFEQDGSHVHARIRQANGQTQIITARYMVACDGGRSPVRKSLGIEMKGSTFEEPWIIVDLVKTFNHGRHTEVFCNPERPTISLPGPGGIRRYEFMLHKGEDPVAAVEESNVRALLASVGPDRDAEFRRVQVYTFHALMAERWREGRVFLAGDAAHLTPPFAGQGMNSGLRDAHNLAWKLDEALRTPDPEAILESYEVERKPHAWSMIQLAMNMGHVMIPTSRFKGFVTRMGFRLLGLYPPARDYFAQMKYKPKPRFKAGLIRTGGVTGPAAKVVGSMIPQPEVEQPDRSRHLLDDLLGDRPVVLIYDPAPGNVIAADALQALRNAGAHVIGITPEWQNPLECDFPVVRDVSQFFSAGAFAPTFGHAFLLRRDRYVVAIAPVTRTLDLLPALSEIRHVPNRSSEPQEMRFPA